MKESEYSQTRIPDGQNAHDFAREVWVEAFDRAKQIIDKGLPLVDDAGERTWASSEACRRLWRHKEPTYTARRNR
ncbi:MAG: hypothetical protein ACO4CZ_14895 [Planctomycetota bacterium]